MKKLNEVMNDCYKYLAKKERVLKTELGKDYAAHSQDITNIVASVYQVATDGDEINFSRLYSRVSQPSIIQLEREMRWVQGLFPDKNIFGGVNFAELNRFQVAQLQFLCAELQTAAKTRDKLKKHLRNYIAYCAEEYYDAFKDEIEEPDLVQVVDEVIEDKTYPLDETIYTEAVNCAERQSVLLKNSLVRGTPLMGKLGAIALITMYARRKEMTNLELISTSQGTRATVETAGAVLPCAQEEEEFEEELPAGASVVSTAKPKKNHAVKYFYSVIADDLACEFCKDIASEQAIHPLPFSMMRPWDTAPPFHPRCRCGIEVIWSDDKDNEK